MKGDPDRRSDPLDAVGAAKDEISAFIRSSKYHSILESESAIRHVLGEHGS